MARGALKARTSWEMADYVGLDWSLLLAILPQLRNLHTFHVDTASLLPLNASGGRAAAARALVAQTVRNNASSLRHAVVVENCFREDSLDVDFISELRPAAANLRSLYTETVLVTQEFVAFLSSACMLTCLSVPNLLSIQLFFDSMRMRFIRLPRLEHLMVKYVSCADLQILGNCANPFDLVLDRFPSIKSVEEFAAPSHNSSELSSYAAERGIVLRKAAPISLWAAALNTQLKYNR